MTDQANTRTPMMPGTDISLQPVQARPLLRELQFAITTDSVVATATVTPGGPLRKILIAWGDGETSSLKSRPGIPAPTASGENATLPQGTYRLSHAYAAPENRMPFEYYALLRVQDLNGGDEIRILKVTLTPRYRVTNYRTSVRLTGHCDPPGHITSEFDISQYVDGTRRRQWHWEPSNTTFGYGQYFVLEDSQISRELTLADSPVVVTFIFTETDFGADTVLRSHPYLNASDQSETVVTKVVEDGGGGPFGICDLLARYEREVSLIVPLPDSGQAVVFS